MTTDLCFSVNTDSPIAVYVQIENQVQFAIAAGLIESGDTLPSVNEMSKSLGVNPNTVTKAYRDLEILGLVHAQRGVGVIVADGVRKRCRDRCLPMVREHLKDSIAECLACGLAAKDVRTLVKQTIDSGALPYEGTS